MLAVCIAAAGALAGRPLPAYGEAPVPSGPGASSGAICPSPNPPNELTLIAGTPQTATLGSPFATGLQVALSDSNGCPVTTAVAGIPVTFSAPAPAGGAGGLFSASGSSSVTVGSDASGTAVAPVFTANDTAGSYTITASSAYGSVLFSLSNAAAQGGSGTCSSSALAALAGAPVKVNAGVGATESTPIRARFPIALAVTVTDAEKNPVPGALVTFSAPARGPSGHFATRARGARPSRVVVRTDACGVAVAPAFTANGQRGGYIVTARAAHVRPAAFALVNAAPGSRP